MAREIYKTIEVTVADGKENVEDLLESTQAEPKTLVAVSTPQVTSNVDLLLYIEREKIVDIPLDTKPLGDKWLEINLDIPVGQKVQAGFRNASGSSITYHITAWYRITGAR